MSDHETNPLWQRAAALAGAVGLVAADHMFKRLAGAKLTPGELTQLIPRVLGLRYVENPGISFSLFGDSETAMRVVTILTGLAMLAGGIFLLLGKLRGAQAWSVSLILAGGVGNWVDRVARGCVPDYFEFLFVHFAVFNFADICITCGVVWLAALLLREEARRRKTAVAP